MRIHVTGASGFLGGHVVPLLLARGHEVTALARTGAAAERVESMGARPVLGDLDDPASIDLAFLASDGQVLVNLASLGFGHAPTIVSAAEDAGMKRAVFVSTTSIFTRLSTPSKPVRIMAEETIRSSGLAWTILRPTMIYGAPGDRNMDRLLRALRRLPALPLPGGGNGLQQPVHVDDLAHAVVSAVERSEVAGAHYDIAGPEALTLRQIVEEAAAAVGRHPVLVPVPMAPAVGAARLYERLASRPRLKAEQLERLREDKVFDIGAARHDLAYDPRAFAAGIREEAALLAGA
jgi:uncharacterized protein YbjT (DUF2867 family)